MIIDCPHIQSDCGLLHMRIIESAGDIASYHENLDSCIIVFLLDIIAWCHPNVRSGPDKIEISELEYLVILDNNESLIDRCLSCIAAKALEELTTLGYIKAETVKSYTKFTKKNVKTSRGAVSHTVLTSMEKVVTQLESLESISIYDIDNVFKECISRVDDIASEFGLRTIKGDLIDVIKKNLKEK